MPCVCTIGALCAYYLQPDNVSDISRVIEMHLTLRCCCYYYYYNKYATSSRGGEMHSITRR